MKRGNCYVTCEALFHLLGGREAGYQPKVMHHEGNTHWFLVHQPTGLVIDPTRTQFQTTPDYTKSRGCGFLTRKLSKRGEVLASQMLWQ